MPIKIENSDLAFESLKVKPYFPTTLQEDISKANVLLIPLENFRNGIDALFPENTDDFLQFLKCNESLGLIPDIVISDEQYKKIEMHCDWLFLGIVLVEYVALPIFINILSNYLYDKIKNNKIKRDSIVEIEINVEETKTKKTKRIRYKGAADDVKKSLDDITEKIFKDE